MWVLSDLECKILVKQVKGLAEYCHKHRNMDPTEPRFGLLVYAEGARDGMVKVLEKMGVPIK